MNAEHALGVMLYGVGEDGAIRAVRVSSAGRMAGIEYGHLAVHDDEFVTATYYNGNFDISGPINVLIKALPGFKLHSVLLVKPSAAVRVQLYEGTEVSADGTPFAHMRNNRRGVVADSARQTTFVGPTVTDAGTLIMDTYTGGQGGNMANRVGGESRSGQEIVLKAGTNYLMVLTAVADNTLIGVNNEYYEVPV